MSARAVYRTGMALKSKQHAREVSRCVDNKMEAGRMVQSQHCEERSGVHQPVNSGSDSFSQFF